MGKKKKIILFIAILCIAITFGGCSMPQPQDPDRQIAQKTKEQMKELNAQIGLPAIKNFQEKKMAKQILELRDREDLITYVYIVNHFTGKLVYIGKAIGYGLPYSVQYTNPLRPLMNNYHNASLLPQPDPNGLFMPEGLSATWIMLLDKKGEPHPVYMEPEIIVSPFPLNNNLIQK